MNTTERGLRWQVGVWDRMSDRYPESRLEPIVEGAVSRANVRSGDAVLDIGTGTGAAAMRASALVGREGRVLGVDISPVMLQLARRRAREARAVNVRFVEGRAEQIPAAAEEFDAIVASLSLMFVLDRAAVARECARVLKPSGRFVAAVWGGPAESDIVLFQTTAGRFAPSPPVHGVGPAALANPEPFVAQLRSAGIDAHVETETTSFEFPSLDAAWDVLAAVTTAMLPPERVEEAKTAVREAMWSDPDEPRTFVNRTLFVVGVRS